MTTRRRAGGSGLLLLVVVIAVIVVATRGGKDPGPFAGIAPAIDRVPATQERGTGTRSVDGAPDADRDTVEFLRFVTADIQNFWNEQFSKGGLDYDPSQLVLFRRAVQTGCGSATSAVGPFYCPADRRVYLDLSFFGELATRFRAPGDFAQAYVVAHEYGHHVQNLTGLTRQVDTVASREPGRQNALSIRTELMADCLAGVWAHSTYQRGLLEKGDLEEGLRAAAAVGDDRIQEQTQGRITPETWTHGSAAQRTSWLRRGFDTGNPDRCDTFSEDAASAT